MDDVNCSFFLYPAQHINDTMNDTDEREDDRSSFIGKVPGVAISLLIVAVVIAAIISIILAGVWLWRRYAFLTSVHVCMGVLV